MGIPQTPSPPHLYSQALQLKLYQAFIFSIPILFSIILFLLFYLFYLKRRASSLSSAPPQSLPIRTFSRGQAYLQSACHVDIEEQLKQRLKTVLFNDELKSRDSQCCVCLGEFEIKEELLQIPSCQHVFHGDCIRYWLQANSTCPLCRCFVIPTLKLHNPVQFNGLDLQQQGVEYPSQNPESLSAQPQQQQEEIVISSSGVAQTVPSELSSSVTITTDSENQESVTINIQTHNA